MSQLEITPEQLAEDPQVIGKTKNGIKVFKIITKGGYNIIAKHAGKGVDILGVASHIGIAKHLAQVKHPDIEFELSKSEDNYPIDPSELGRWEIETIRWQLKAAGF